MRFEFDCGSARVGVGSPAPVEIRRIPPTGTGNGVLNRAFVLLEGRRIGMVSWEPRVFPAAQAFPSQLHLLAQATLPPGVVPGAPDPFELGGIPFLHWQLPAKVDDSDAVLHLLRSTSDAPIHGGTLTMAFWGSDASTLSDLLQHMELDIHAPRSKRRWTVAHLTSHLSVLCLTLLALASIASDTPVFGRDEAATEWSLLPLLMAPFLFFGLFRRRTWAVVLLLILNGTVAGSGIAICAVLKAIGNSSSYIPALREGGALAGLWVAAIATSALSLIMALFRFSDLAED